MRRWRTGMTQAEYEAEIEDAVLSMVRDGRFWNLNLVVSRVTTFTGAYRPDVEEIAGRLLEHGIIRLSDGYYVTRGATDH